MMGADISDAEADRLSEEKEGFYREIVYAAPSLQVLTPGAEEMLDHLKARGIPFAIATGSIKTNVDFYMNTLRIDRWFDYDHIFYAHDDIPGKPDPAVYRLAMQKLGYRPEDTVVVEDGLAGVQPQDEGYILFTGKYGYGKNEKGTIPALSALAYYILIDEILPNE
jgi:HAD superfamily hydrolase (TIGR01509 family)